jgi:hypothetical protein
MKVAEPMKRTADPLDRFNCAPVMFRRHADTSEHA